MNPTIHKKISLIDNQDMIYDIQEQIEDRFGTMPKSVQMLLDVALVKADAHRLGIVSIAEKQKNIVITFKSDAGVDTERITQMLMEKDSPYMFTAAQEPYITIKTSPRDEKNPLEYIKTFIQDLTKVEN